MIPTCQDLDDRFLTKMRQRNDQELIAGISGILAAKFTSVLDKKRHM